MLIARRELNCALHRRKRHAPTQLAIGHTAQRPTVLVIVSAAVTTLGVAARRAHRRGDGLTGTGAVVPTGHDERTRRNVIVVGLPVSGRVDRHA